MRNGSESDYDPFSSDASVESRVTDAMMTPFYTPEAVDGDILLSFPIRVPGAVFHNEFCSRIFRQMRRIPGGTILWAYLKPLLRGRIVFYPDTHEAWAIIQQANSTFRQMLDGTAMLRSMANSTFLLRTLEVGLDEAATLPELIDLTDSVLRNRFMRATVRQALSDAGDAAEPEMLSSVVRHLFSDGRSNLEIIDRLAEFARRAADFTECVNLEERFVAVDSLFELQQRAREFAEEKELLAAIVFRNLPLKSQPDGALRLPRQIEYEIRMDIDNVPATDRIKDYYYRPGPRDDFFDDLRYLRGFSQVRRLRFFCSLTLRLYIYAHCRFKT